MRRGGCIEKNDPSEVKKKKESGSLGEKKKMTGQHETHTPLPLWAGG